MTIIFILYNNVMTIIIIVTSSLATRKTNLYSFWISRFNQKSSYQLRIDLEYEGKIKLTQTLIFPKISYNTHAKDLRWRRNIEWCQEKCT